MDDKSAFRAHVQELAGMTMKQTRASSTASSNGARSSRHYSFKTFETLEYHRDTLDRLNADPLVIELLVGIKEIWLALAACLEKVHITK